MPVGTVRSRLNQARTKLDRALRATAAAAHYDTAALTARRRDEAEDLLSSAVHGQFRATLAAATVPDLHVIGRKGKEHVVGTPWPTSWTAISTPESVSG